MSLFRQRETIAPLIDADRLPETLPPFRIAVSRRGMRAAGMDSLEAQARTRRGLPAYVIEDLTSFPETELLALKPVVQARAKISLKEQCVWAETSVSADPIPLFMIASPALFVFNQFNGQQTLSEIVQKTAAEKQLSTEDALRLVRTVFLKLCEVRVCEPGQ